MALINIFKKEEAEPKTDKQKSAVKPVSKKEPKAAVAVGAKASHKKSGQTLRVLKHAHITEKASRLAEGNNYVFMVAPGANKTEIARAVEGYYGVDVVGVNTINVPGKRKRRGKGIAVEPGYRKAIVEIKKGQSIEVLPR